MAEIAPVFADYNSTTPLCSDVLDSIQGWGNRVGNISSSHQFGQRMHHFYDEAVEKIQTLFQATSYDLFTCASATEANNWLFYSLFQTSDLVKEPPRVIISAIEHACVSQPLLHYAEQGLIDLQVCRVTSEGIIDLDHFDSLLTPTTTLVSVILANNEIGTIQPLAVLAEKAHRVGAIVHSDIVQAAGKIPINCIDLGIDIAVLSSHKCYAPTGCGVLLVRDSNLLKPMLFGGSQQQKLRAGTVNAMGLHLFAIGLTYCYNALPTHLDVHSWATALCRSHKALSLLFPLSLETCLWNTVPMVISDHLAHDAMMRLDMMGVAISTGSACSTGAVETSPTIQALGISDAVANSVVRLSFGYPTTPHDLTTISAAFDQFFN